MRDEGTAKAEHSPGHSGKKLVLLVTVLMVPLGSRRDNVPSFLFKCPNAASYMMIKFIAIISKRGLIK